MNKHIISGLVLATALFTTTAAVAGPDCTTEPQEKWMSEMDMQKKIVNDYGFTMYKFKVTSGNCYEIYGTAPKTAPEEGKAEDKAEDKAESNIEERVKTEIYFHPVSGDIVKQTIEE